MYFNNNYDFVNYMTIYAVGWFYVFLCIWYVMYSYYELFWDIIMHFLCRLLFLDGSRYICYAAESLLTKKNNHSIFFLKDYV